MVQHLPTTHKPLGLIPSKRKKGKKGRKEKREEGKERKKKEGRERRGFEGASTLCELSLSRKLCWEGGY